MKTTLPLDSTARKRFPIYSGVMQYFPAAIAGVAWVSDMGNRKHNPGQPLHWSREKSSDHPDCTLRHMIDANDNDGYEPIAYNDKGEMLNHWATVDGRPVGPPQVYYEAWRSLARAQIWAEQHEGAPLAPGAVPPLPATLEPVKPPRPTLVAATVVVHAGRVLLGKRKDQGDLELDGRWEVPGGKVEHGESPEIAARRELREETGILAEFLDLLPAVKTNVYAAGTPRERTAVVIPFRARFDKDPTENTAVITDQCPYVEMRWFTWAEVELLGDLTLRGTLEFVKLALT